MNSRSTLFLVVLFLSPILFISPMPVAHAQQITSGTWSLLPDFPAPENPGAAISIQLATEDYRGCAADAGFMFAFQGGGSSAFRKILFYPTNCPSSSTPVGWLSLANTPAPTGSGAALTTAPGIVGAPFDLIFAMRGNGTKDFWAYNITSDTWTTLAPTPGPVGDGGSVVETCCFTVYALQGGGTNGFWRYDISTNQWTVLPSTPNPVASGGAITQLQTIGVVFAFTGGSTSKFWEFAIGSNTWTPVADAPGPVGSGGALSGTNYANLGNLVGALQGGGTTGFWLYNASANAWQILPSVPTPVRSGGGLSTLNVNGGCFAAFVGGGSSQVPLYFPGQCSVTPLRATSGTVSCGPPGRNLKCAIAGNATVSNVNYDGRSGDLSFTATGSKDTTACFNVTIPMSAVPNQDYKKIDVVVNGTTYTWDSIPSLTITWNTTDFFVYFCLTFHSSYLIVIPLAASVPSLTPAMIPLAILAVSVPIFQRRHRIRDRTGIRRS